MRMMNNHVGIDYSMNGPSICVHCGEKWSFDNCRFYYVTSKKKCQIITNQFNGHPAIEFSTQEERFDLLSEWCCSCIPKNSHILIEGYAFASKGLVYHIGECCGILKHKLYKRDLKFGVIAPGTLKKFASGKGNATKPLMYKAFLQETKCNLESILNTSCDKSPVNDIVDSYFLCKYLFFHGI